MRYALIGCGRIAVNHLKACKNNQLELCALCDIDLIKISQLIDKIEFTEYKDVPRYADYKEMIQQEKPELVSIATESGCHAEIAAYCMEHGVHVIIEKPVAMSMKDADMLVELAQKNHVKACACHQNRFNPAVQAVRQALEQERFGKLSHGSIHVRWNRNEGYYNHAKWRGTWQNDGGALMNQCIHGIDLLRWMFGTDVEEVYGQTRQQFHDYLEAEDVGMAVVKFKNGAVATIEGTTNVYPQNLEETLYIFGQNGTVKIGGTSTNNIDVWDFKDVVEDDETKRSLKEATSNVYGNGHTALFADMIAAIKEDRKPYVDIVEGRNALEMVLAIYKSQRTGMPVKFPLKEFASTDMVGYFEDKQEGYFVHSSAAIDSDVQIGSGTKIWHFSHIQEKAIIGAQCSLGQNVNIANGVRIGNGVKIQNNVSIYSGVELENNVFCGPSCVFTNDITPRSKYPKGFQNYKKTLVKEGASIGANATILCGNTIGKWALIAAGAVVTKDVKDYALMAGVPARQIGWVCECGEKLSDSLICSCCGKHYKEYSQGLEIE